MAGSLLPTGGASAADPRPRPRRPSAEPRRNGPRSPRKADTEAPALHPRLVPGIGASELVDRREDRFVIPRVHSGSLIVRGTRGPAVEERLQPSPFPV